MYSKNSDPYPFGHIRGSTNTVPGAPHRPLNIVDLLRQTFASVNSAPSTGSTSPRSLQVLHIKELSGDESWEDSMSSPPKRHLPDVRYSLSPSPQHGRGDKRGQHYGSAGDVTAISRVDSNEIEENLSMDKDINKNSDPEHLQYKTGENGDDQQIGQIEHSSQHGQMDFVMEPSIEYMDDNPMLETDPNINPQIMIMNDIKKKEQNAIDGVDRFEAVDGLIDGERGTTITDKMSAVGKRHKTKAPPVSKKPKMSMQSVSSKNPENDELTSEDETNSVTNSPKNTATEKNRAITSLQDNFDYGTIGCFYKDDKPIFNNRKSDQAVLIASSREQNQATAHDNPPNPPSILQRKPPVVGRKPTSVQFSNEVTVETFCRTDQASGSSTTNDLAVKNGLSPDPAVEYQGAGSAAGIPSSNFLEKRSFALGMEKSGLPMKEPPGQRKNSMPTVKSPTELLREKQKTLTNKVMQSVAMPPSISNNLQEHIDYSDNTLTFRKLLVPATYTIKHKESLAEPCKTLQAERPTCLEKTSDQSSDISSLLIQHHPDTLGKAKNKETAVGLATFSTTSPSQLHEKKEDREKAERNMPNMTLSYTSPLKLHQKIKDLGETEKNMLGLNIFSNTSPSKLHQKIEERKKAERNVPVNRSVSCTPLSKPHQKKEVKEEGEEKVHGLDLFNSTSPTNYVHLKIKDIEKNEKNILGLNLFNNTPASNIRQKMEDIEKFERNRKGRPLGNFSLSKISKKIEVRENVQQNVSDPGSFSYTSSSKQHLKIQDSAEAQQNTTGFGQSKPQSKEKNRERSYFAGNPKEQINTSEITCISSEMAESVNMKSIFQKWRERCKRKQRIDGMQKRIHDNSDVNHVVDTDTNGGTGRQENENITEQAVKDAMKRQPEYETKGLDDTVNTGHDEIKTTSNTISGLHPSNAMVSHLLSSPLSMIKEKTATGLAMLIDGHREMGHIQKTKADTSQTVTASPGINENDRVERNGSQYRQQMKSVTEQPTKDAVKMQAEHEVDRHNDAVNTRHRESETANTVSMPYSSGTAVVNSSIDPDVYMNTLLSEFLSLTREKIGREEIITRDDYREMELIMRTIAEISRKMPSGSGINENDHKEGVGGSQLRQNMKSVTDESTKDVMKKQANSDEIIRHDEIGTRHEKETTADEAGQSEIFNHLGRSSAKDRSSPTEVKASHPRNQNESSKKKLESSWKPSIKNTDTIESGYIPESEDNSSDEGQDQSSEKMQLSSKYNGQSRDCKDTTSDRYSFDRGEYIEEISSSEISLPEDSKAPNGRRHSESTAKTDPGEIPTRQLPIFMTYDNLVSKSPVTSLSEDSSHPSATSTADSEDGHKQVSSQGDKYNSRDRFFKSVSSSLVFSESQKNEMNSKMLDMFQLSESMTGYTSVESIAQTPHRNTEDTPPAPSADIEWSPEDGHRQLSPQAIQDLEWIKNQYSKMNRFIKNGLPSPNDEMDTKMQKKVTLSKSTTGNTSTESIDGSFVETPNKVVRGTPYPSSIHLLANPSFDVDFDDDEGNEDIEKDSATKTSSQQDMDSLAVCNPSTKGDIISEESVIISEKLSPKQISWLTSVNLPEETTSVQVDLGPSWFIVNMAEENVEHELDKQLEMKSPENKHTFKEGSPDRGQKLYGSSQNLDRRQGESAAKRKQAGRSMTPDSRSFMLEREVSDSQVRKLQMENSTLQTENKLLKEKFSRSQARISDLETELSDTQEDLNNLHENINREVSDLTMRTRQEIDRGRDQLQDRIVTLSKENEELKLEVSSLEKQLDSSHRVTEMARHNSEKSRTLEAYKTEITSLKEEINLLKALLDQSERHLREEEERHRATSTQVLKLTELKNALQQQSDMGGSGTVTDKQLKSLEKRLKITEDRLHQERSDRANNLSAVEEKLLTENARLQAVEKDFTRQLHREKEKNRNMEQKVKQLREENEKLRLAMPFDDSTLLSIKGPYDIPYSSHSNERAETKKYISDDMNYIFSQIEKQEGLHSKAGDEIIRRLWNKRELAYQLLREYDINLQELQLNENCTVEGLKNLRDTYGQAESKLHAMEEHVADARANVLTLDTTYKEQLGVLVRERHDAFARLKTAEDLLEGMRMENEILRTSSAVSQTSNASRQSDVGDKDRIQSMKVEITGLESKVAQLMRAYKLMEGEFDTVRVQLEARNKALQDAQCELDLAYNRLQGEDTDDRKQQKIDKLSSQVSSLQVELKLWTDKYNNLATEKSKSEAEVATLKRESDTHKVRQQKTEQVESKVLQNLRDDLADKESNITSLGKQLDDVGNQLQKTRQELYIEQLHTSELESEVDVLQRTASQRAQMFESLSGTEREQLAQYQILKDTLDSINQELAQKHAQIISLDINLSSQKDKTTELEDELAKLRRDESENDPDGKMFTADEQSLAHELRINELDKERAQLKKELLQAYSAITAAEEQYRTLKTESTQLEQELVKEKTVILQITAEKGEIEQHLEELAEEHDSLIQEKSQAEDDLMKLETKLQEILAKYETEARKQHSNFEKQYPNLPHEARKLVSELDSLKLMVEGKDREIDMLQDKITRQHIEIDFLQRKVELVHNDSISNREDVARMISELTLKMKEAVSTREVNQFLVGERTKLQNDKSHLEVELERERKLNDQRRQDINDVIHKIENTEKHHKFAEKSFKDKDIRIVSLESDMRNIQQNAAAMETKNSQMKNRLEHLNKDLTSLTTINTTLEQRFEMEKISLSEEKNASAKWKEECNHLSHELEILRHEHKILSDKYDADVKSLETLRRDLDKTCDHNSSLQEELRNMKYELDTSKGQLLLSKDTAEKLGQDKGSLYKEYEGMCRSLTEKERQLVDLKKKSEEKIEQMKDQYIQDRARLEQDRAAAAQERDLTKKEMDNLNEQLKQKEIQLSTFGKTLQELEMVTRKKRLLDDQVQKLERSTGDSRVLLEGQRKELMALNESIAKQQEKMTRLQADNHTMQASMKSQLAADSQEIHELQLTINELKSQHENERTYLSDSLTKTQTTLRSVEASLASAVSERDTVMAQKHLLDKTLEEVQAELSDACTGRRLAEQSVGSLRLQLEDSKTTKNVAEARLMEFKTQLTKTEEQLKAEQERNKKLYGRLQELNALSRTTEQGVKAKGDQLETLQKEISKLKQMIETQKLNMTGKLKKSAMEFKQQLDLVQEDRVKLQKQNHQLSTDLDICREQIATKNRDNLTLQEDKLGLEDSVRESKTKQKQAEETLRVEAERQTQLSSSSQPPVAGTRVDEERFHEQDEELKRLRNFLAKKMEDSGDADKSMWQEMNKVIQELSRQMQDHLDSQRSGNNDAKPSGDAQLLRFKKMLAEVQGELSTERSLHQITRASLQALEEDCARLRQQMRSIRRRDPPSSERKYKNRNEAINAIIARSQSQAQALLASGGYHEDSMASPRLAYHSPRMGFQSPHRPESPDNSYGDDLSIASLPPMHYGTHNKMSPP